MEKMFSTTEVAKMLGISRIAVFKQVKNGKIKAVRMGRGYFIAKSDLLVLVKKRLAKENRLADKKSTV